MNEEMVDIELNLGKEIADKINGMTKKELINDLIVLILKERVQEETIDRVEKERQNLEKKLSKAESDVEQGRAMIEASMQRWYKY
jgi:hypothetical protein